MNYEFDPKWAVESIPDALGTRVRRTNKTFLGAYLDCYETCTRYWHSASTHKQYNNYINKIILPNLDEHNSKSIDEYTKKDFENAIERIKEGGQQRKSENGYKPYSDNTIQAFRNIIARIVAGCAKHGYCENLFVDSYFLLSYEEALNSVDSILLVMKSVPIETEIEIIEYLLSDPKAPGELVGVLLVIACGLRINESAAVNFGNIYPMVFYPDWYKLYVFESVMQNSNKLKEGGKTDNADRVIPLYDRVTDFFFARKKYIEEELKKQGLDVAADTLPMACVGINFTERCTTRRISDAAREVFAKFGVKPEVLQIIDANMEYSELGQVKERNPSGYLGRHIFATQLELLDLDESEIQAIIGHDIEDSREQRNDFSSDEKLIKIKQKMDRNPIYRREKKTVKVSEIETSFTGTGPLNLIIDEKVSFLSISAECEEPADNMIIETTADNGSIILGEKTPCFRRGIDIMQKYEEIYERIKAAE